MVLQVRKIQINAVLILSWVHESPHWGIKQKKSQNMNKIVQGIIPNKYDQEEKWKEGAMKIRRKIGEVMGRNEKGIHEELKY